MKLTSKYGFTFIELIIAIGLTAIFLLPLSRVLSFSVRSAAQGEKISQANALAQEGMEAIFYIKSTDPTNWAWELSSPADGTYQPDNTSGTWTLGGIVPTPTVKPVPYTRTVQISHIKRSMVYPFGICDEPCNNPLAPVDELTRKIITTVTWPEANGTQQVFLESYVTEY